MQLLCVRGPLPQSCDADRCFRRPVALDAVPDAAPRYWAASMGHVTVEVIRCEPTNDNRRVDDGPRL